MRLSAFLAHRLVLSGTKRLSKLTVYMAVGSVALGVAVMLISVSVVQGFKQELTHKLAGFSGDIRITGYLANQDDSLRPILLTDTLLQQLSKRFPQVEQITPYVEKEAILKSETGIEGIRAWGVDDGWDSAFFKAHLVAGRLPKFSQKQPYGTEVLISRRQAQRLMIAEGQTIRIFFEQAEKIRSRSLMVVGIYETGMAELDAQVILCHIALLQRIMRLPPEAVMGLQLRAAKGTNLFSLTEALEDYIRYDQQAQPVQVLFDDLFVWLDLQQMNVIIIIGLMIFVAILNMSSALVILVTERTHAVGILKALGATPAQVRKIFMRVALRLLFRGILWGNLIGLGLLFIQYTTRVFALDSESYFVQAVPVAWPWLTWLLLNVSTLLICLVAMFIPVQVVNRIRIVRALRF